MIREQTKKLQALVDEFKVLKEKLFQGHAFVVMDHNDPEVKRYEQLLMFFYPCYRTKEFVSPLK